MTDQEIINELKQGRDDSFKELILRYESRIAATVFGMLGRCPEAEDVGQETFVRFYRNVKNFRSEAGVITYLTRIAINLSLNELKKRKRNRSLFVRNTDTDTPIADFENAVDTKEIVHAAIAKLSPKFRAVLVLRMIDGFSTEETAKILRVPAGTVLSRLSRAQEKVKIILTPLLEESL